MVDDFIAGVRDALKAAGIDAKVIFDDNLEVAGCRFTGDIVRSQGKDYGVRFLGSGFKVEKDGSFDVAKAVGLVIAALPKRLEENAANERYWKAKRAIKEALPGVNAETSHAYRETWPHPMGALLSASNRGLEVTFVVQNVDEALNLMQSVQK